MYTKPKRPDEIYHAGQRKNHKYIARIDLGDKFRYFYSQAEIAAYEAARRAGQAVDKAVDAAKEGASKAADATRKVAGDAAKAIDKKVDAVADSAKKVGQVVDKKVDEVVDDTKKVVDKAGKAVYDKTEGVRKAVDKAGKTVSDTAKGAADKVTGTAKAVGKTVDDTGKKVGGAIDSVKKAFSDDNQYVVKKKTYKQKKEEIQNTQEWKDIIRDYDSEYRKRDSKGNQYYDFDQYLVDKKHPILDALSDFGMGRKISIRKQSPETLVAGVKDYIKMAEDTVQTIAGLSIGLLTAKIKNQQGSYEDEKKKLKKQFNNVSRMLSMDNPQAALAIDQIAKEVKSRTSNDLANDLIDVATKVAQDSVDANGKVKKPSRDTINSALDDVAEIAKSKAKNQSERDKIDLAAQKAKDYQNMSRDEIKNDIKTTAENEARRVAGDAVVNEAKNFKTQQDINRARKDLNERKQNLNNPNFVESKREVIDGQETYKFMTRQESLDDIKKQESKLDKAESNLKNSPAAKVSEYINNNPKASAGISAYAREKGLSYNEARAELMKLPLSTIKKYSEKAR